MQGFRRLVLAVVVLGVWTVPSRPAEEENKEKKAKPSLVAQEGAVRLALLRHKSVQDELKLDADTDTKIDKFASHQWKKAQELKTDDDTTKAQWEQMAKENDKFLHETLSKEQLHRLNQITMQHAGLLWVLRPEVAKKLNLTDEQREQALKLHKEAHKEAEEFLHGKASDEERQAKMKELHKINHKRLHDLLTEEQRSKWKEMEGEPFRGDFHFPKARKEEK